MVAMLTPSAVRSSSTDPMKCPVLVDLFGNHEPVGFAGDPTNVYRYVENSPPNGTDPDGLETRRQGRTLGGRKPAWRGAITPSHEYIFTIDPNGQIHTYSWGNDLKDPNCPSHWYKDQLADLEAAKEALKKGGTVLGPVIGDGSLDPYIDETYDILHDAGPNSPSAHPHGGFLDNCKAEATRLAKLAKALQDLDKRYPRQQDRDFWRERVKADFGILPQPEVMPPLVPGANQ